MWEAILFQIVTPLLFSLYYGLESIVFVKIGLFAVPAFMFSWIFVIDKC